MPEAPVLRDVYDKIRVVELQWIPMADGAGWRRACAAQRG
jgi:hypothetical protein